MKHGRLNIILGAVTIIVAGVGGFALGYTVEHHFILGHYSPDLPRFLRKAGHSHGMPMAFYNLIVGGLIDRLELSAGEKTWCSRLAAGALLMPVGLLLRGLDNGALTFAPLALAGGLSLMASAALILKGALAAR